MTADDRRDAAQPGTRKRVRTGGRSEQVRQAVASTVLDLLAEGTVDFTVTDVAARAGLNRTTIYRWWPTYADLIREALTAHTSAIDVPDTGSWTEDLRELARRLAVFFAGPVEVSTSAVMVSRRAPDLSALIIDHFAPVQRSWQKVVERGIARGEVRPDCDPEAVINMLASQLVLAPLVLYREATQDEIDALVDLVLRATCR